MIYLWGSIAAVPPKVAAKPLSVKTSGAVKDDDPWGAIAAPAPTTKVKALSAGRGRGCPKVGCTEDKPNIFIWDVFVANIGDAKAVLARSADGSDKGSPLKAIVLTREHKSTRTCSHSEGWLYCEFKWTITGASLEIVTVFL